MIPTLSERCGGHREVLGGEDLELDAPVDGLEAGGEVQLSVTNLDNGEIRVSGKCWFYWEL